VRLKELEESLKRVKDVLHPVEGGPSSRGSVDEATSRLNDLLFRIGAGAVPADHLEPVGKGAGDYLDLLLRSVRDAIGGQLTDRQELLFCLETGKAYEVLGEWDRALERFRLAESLSEELEDRSSKAESLKLIGTILTKRNNWDRAIKYLELSLELFEQVGDRRGVATVCQCIGNIHFEQGEWEKVREHYNRALEIAQEIDETSLIADLNNNLGALATAQGDWEKALLHYEKSLPAYEKMGDLRGLSWAYHNLGMLYADRKEVGEGWRLLREELGDLEGYGQPAAHLYDLSEQSRTVHWILRPAHGGRLLREGARDIE